LATRSSARAAASDLASTSARRQRIVAAGFLGEYAPSLGVG